jgi:hypothetical protein
MLHKPPVVYIGFQASKRLGVPTALFSVCLADAWSLLSRLLVHTTRTLLPHKCLYPSHPLSLHRAKGKFHYAFGAIEDRADNLMYCINQSLFHSFRAYFIHFTNVLLVSFSSLARQTPAPLRPGLNARGPEARRSCLRHVR